MPPQRITMEKPIKLFIIEDEMIIGANISLQLSKLGYEVTGIVSRGEEALEHIKQNKPDIVLMDIQLKGKLDGIQTAELIKQNYSIPIIFLTANSDDVHFNRAKATKPAAFISKPFRNIDLERAIELTISRMMTDVSQNVNLPKNKLSPFILSDSIFVKANDKMVKIVIENIYYIEAERNYCQIFSKDKSYLLVMTLKDIGEKLPAENFFRVHRSFIVNLAHIDEVAGTHIVVSRKAIPLSKTCREDLLKHLQTI